jgi:glycerophosphoryl diester phosphodiesterase
MAAVELDIKHIVNWYFFARFNLTSVPRTYEGLENVGHWMPLFVFVVFLSSYVACPRKTYLAQIIYITVILHNILMFVYMVVAGQKIIRFFIVTLPIQLVYQLHNVWWLLLLAPTVLVVTCYVVPCKTSRLKPTCEHVSPAPFCCLSVKSSAVGLIVVLALHLTIPAAIAWMVRVGCLPCEGKLPKKPGLIAHRGCGFVYPENTIMSFVKSTQIPGMIGLETDVQISYDGVPFLLHDPHTVRTTDVQTKCPDVDPLGNATWLHFSSGTCPLEKLNVGSWFSRERGDRDSELAREFSQELIPRLQQYLHVAKEHGMTIIFDVTEPNIAHPLHDHYLNISLNAVLSSGIHPSKVWWLAPEKREWVVAKYPDLVQVTKTEDTPFEQFRELKIRVVNDDWSTPLKTLR